MIGTIHTIIVDQYPKDFAFATTAAQIEAAHKQGKIAALIGVEGGHAIDDSLDKLREFYGRGARYMTLTHTNTNHWADSSGDINDAEGDASQRAHGFRQGCGARDEPAGHDGGYFACGRSRLFMTRWR